MTCTSFVVLFGPATANMTIMSSTAQVSGEFPNGVGLLPLDLTSAQLAAAPILAGTDMLLIEDLTDDEHDAFAAALRW